MKKTILCLLLALGLLLMSAAAMATSDPSKYEFDITEGDITIADGSAPGTVRVTYGVAQTTTPEFDASQGITLMGETTEHAITIRATTPVTITLSDLRVSLTKEGVSPMYIDENGDVTLILKNADITENEYNILRTDAAQPGIYVATSSRLTIDGNGALKAEGNCSGMGTTNASSKAGTIIINGGEVKVGGSATDVILGYGGSLILAGGSISNSSSTSSGGHYDVDTLIIPDFGSLDSLPNEQIETLYAFLVIEKETCRFKQAILPNSSNSLIVTAKYPGDSTETPPSDPTTPASLTLPVDLTIPEGKTLNIPNGSSLIIPEGVTLTIPEGAALLVDGNLNVKGNLILNGTMTGSGSALFPVALHANGGTIGSGDVKTYTYGVGAALPTDVTRDGYAFAGWYADRDLTAGPVTEITATDAGVKEYWAGWIALPTVTSPTEDRTVTVYEGEQATMSITAENAVSYRWMMSTDGGNSWTGCGGDGPTYTTSPTTLENSGYRYLCVVTGSGTPEKQAAQRSVSRAANDAATNNAPSSVSPVFTLEVIRREAVPNTGDDSRPGLWLALGLVSAAALAAFALRGRKNGKV